MKLFTSVIPLIQTTTTPSPIPPSISETFPCHILLPNLSKCSPSTTDSRNYAWRTITLRHTILRAYFNISSTKKKHKGLYHLRQASIGEYRNGTYLYGLLLLVLEHYPKGKKYLDKLQWKENLSTSDYCWKRVKKTLSTIPAIMETRYYTAMVNLEPWTECHPDNMAEVCKHCYYSKRLTQFVQFAMNQD
ncbi:hypothetical protein Bca101_030247 [Brassica carinata]